MKKLSFTNLFQARINKKAEEAQFFKYFLFFRAGSEREAAEVPLPPSTKKRVCEQKIRGNVVQELFRPFCDSGLLSLAKMFAPSSCRG